MKRIRLQYTTSEKIYFTLLFLIILFLIGIQAAFRPDQILTRKVDERSFNDGWTYLRNDIVTAVDNQFPQTLPAPGQSEIILTNMLPSVKTEDMVLAFFTYHQLVAVYIDDTLVYQLDSDGDPLRKTPGIVWNRIDISAEQLGKEIEIHSRPAFQDVLGYVTGFRIGNRFDIFKAETMKIIEPLFICIGIFMIGIMLFGWMVILWEQITNRRRIFYISLFAMLFAVWSFSETVIPQIFFNASVIFYYINYVGLLLIPFPSLFYIRETFLSGKKWMINSALLLNLAILCIEIGLHVSGISNFRSLLFLTVIAWCYTLFVFLVMMFENAKLKPPRGRIQFWIYHASTVIIILIALMELIFFYRNDFLDGSLSFRRFILFYFLIFGYAENWKSAALMERGVQLEVLKRMSYTDVLTSIKNRAAFKEAIAFIARVHYPRYRLVMMDLNDLKKVNDHLGHLIGDQYVIDSAALISSAFAKYGESYRLSGDEFCSVLKDCNDRAYQNCLMRLNQDMAEMSRTAEFNYSIACGDAFFDPMRDQDLMDTLKRADLNMYKEKQKMKSK